MKKEGSTASMLWLDIRRGFCSKRFWGIVGVVTIVFVVFLTLDIIYPLQKYYNGYGTFDWKLDSISMAPFAVRIGMHIAKLNGRICGAKRSHSVFEQPNCYQSV